MVRIYKAKNKDSLKKKNARKWFNKYIRLRDAIKTTGNIRYCRCITCGETFPMSKIHCGHGIGGSTGAVLFDEKIANGQCYDCNVTHGGEYQKYKSVLIERHGEEWFDMKMQARKTPVTITEEEYGFIADEYRKKVNEILKEYE
jgi:hypothetical protein